VSTVLIVAIPVLIVAIPVLKAAIKSIKIKSHGNNVSLCDIIIAHAISVDAQTNKQTNKA